MMLKILFISAVLINSLHASSYTDGGMFERLKKTNLKNMLSIHKDETKPTKHKLTQSLNGLNNGLNVEEKTDDTLSNNKIYSAPISISTRPKKNKIWDEDENYDKSAKALEDFRKQLQDGHGSFLILSMVKRDLIQCKPPGYETLLHEINERLNNLYPYHST